MKTVLSIAGSDCSGGAGIQADIKTITMHGCYAMSIITALTAQNTLGVSNIKNINTDFIDDQFTAIFSDIVPDAIKIGMLGNLEIAKCVKENLDKYQPKNIVLDPVMVSTSGSILLEDNAINYLKSELIPLANIITPNIYETEILSGIKINSKADINLAITKIREYYQGIILIKGGHFSDDANDYLIVGDQVHIFQEVKIANDNTHGTGCTLSSSIAANLALNNEYYDAVKLSKNYISNAIKANLNLGHGQGPLAHNFALKIK